MLDPVRKRLRGGIDESSRPAAAFYFRLRSSEKANASRWKMLCQSAAFG